LRNKNSFIIASAVAIFLTIFLYALLHHLEFDSIANIIPLVIPIVAALFIFNASRFYKHRSYDRKLWFLFAIGMIFWFLGEVVWFYYESMLAIYPFPTFGDVFFVLGYCFMIAGLLLYFKLLKDFISLKNTIVPLIFAIIAAIIVSKLLVFPILMSTEYDFLSKLFSTSYLILDFTILVIGFVLIRFSSRAWGIVILSFMFITIADIIFAYIDWFGLYSAFDVLLNNLWLIGYMLLAVAAQKQKLIFLNHKLFDR